MCPCCGHFQLTPEPTYNFGHRIYTIGNCLIIWSTIVNHEDCHSDSSWSSLSLYDHKDPPHSWTVIDSWTTKNNVSILTTWLESQIQGLPSTPQVQSTLHITTLDYTMQISPSTKHSSVNIPPYYDYDMLHNTENFRPNLSYNRDCYVHKWWDPHVFPVSYVASTLEHVGESWGLLRALGIMGDHGGTLRALENLRESYEHISSILFVFSYLCIVIMYTEWHFTLI